MDITEYSRTAKNEIDILKYAVRQNYLAEFAEFSVTFILSFTLSVLSVSIANSDHL